MDVSLGQVVYGSTTVANGTDESGVITTNGMSLCGIQLPATMTSTSITFEAATTKNGTYQPIYNKSGQVSYTITSGQFLAIDPADFYGVQFLKIKTGSNEGADRALAYALKGI